MQQNPMKSIFLMLHIFMVQTLLFNKQEKLIPLKKTGV